MRCTNTHSGKSGEWTGSDDALFLLIELQVSMVPWPLGGLGYGTVLLGEKKTADGTPLVWVISGSRCR